MDDLISRQAAIDALKGLEFHQYMEFGEYIGEDTREVRLIRAEKAQDALQKLPSAQPEQRWIPCSERLPEERGEYLVTVLRPNNRLTVSNDYYNDQTNAWWHFINGVTAWMPLPEPYKGE